jgi:hypothetical protein
MFDLGKRFAGNSTVMAAFDGLDNAVGGNLRNPNPIGLVKTAAETLYEGLPGDQKTSMDTGAIERGIGAVGDVNKGNAITDTAVRSNVAAGAGRYRERGAQAVVNSGFKALAPRIASRFAGAGASGGTLAPIMGALAVYDVADVAAEVITGRGIGDHAQNPDKIDTSTRREQRGGAINAPTAPSKFGTSGAWSRRRK